METSNTYAIKLLRFRHRVTIQINFFVSRRPRKKIPLPDHLLPSSIAAASEAFLGVITDTLACAGIDPKTCAGVRVVGRYGWDCVFLPRDTTQLDRNSRWKLVIFLAASPIRNLNDNCYLGGREGGMEGGSDINRLPWMDTFLILVPLKRCLE